LITELGALKKEIRWIGIEFKTEFSKVTLPPIETYMFFQDDRRFLRHSTTPFQDDRRLGLAPTKIPRYLNGNNPILQFRKSNAENRNSSLTFTPNTLLLRKLTFMLEAQNYCHSF
jgi:hypothetical protein